MTDIIISLLQLVGVVSLVGFIGAVCAAIALAFSNPWPRTQPMFIGGEYRAYVNRRSYRERK